LRSAPGRTRRRIYTSGIAGVTVRPIAQTKPLSLAGDRGDHYRGLLACGGELAIAVAETNLRLPCNVPHWFWLAYMRRLIQSVPKLEFSDCFGATAGFDRAKSFNASQIVSRT
jgi:hypothetical protein